MRKEPTMIGSLFLAVGIVIASVVIETLIQENGGYEKMSIARLRRKLRHLIEADTTESYKEACIVRDLITEKIAQLRKIKNAR
jgi:hypothetical protein